MYDQAPEADGRIETCRASETIKNLALALAAQLATSLDARRGSGMMKLELDFTFGDGEPTHHAVLKMGVFRLVQQVPSTTGNEAGEG